MLTQSKQAGAQVLVISDTRVRYHLWKNRVLKRVAEMGHTEEDLAQCQELLIENSKLPVIFITDFSEEIFKNETVVHVSGNDLKAMFNRKLNHTFRHTPYRSARVVGRENQGRRDDHILLSALTKPQTLKPWVNLALDNKLRIQSITSVAYVVENYTQTTSLRKNPYQLIVILENNNKMRQTFLRKGKMFFSRSTTLTESVDNSLSADIYRETISFRRYLERIRLLTPDDMLDIQFYSLSDGAELSFKPSDSDNLNISIQRMIDQAHFDSSEPNIPENSTGLFLTRIMGSKKVDNIYASITTRLYFLLDRAGKSLIYGSIALIITAMVYKIPMALDILDKREKLDQNIANATPLERQYEVSRLQFPETPIPSNEMALVVESMESIQSQSTDTTYLVNALTASMTRAPDLKITSLDWEQIEINDGSNSRSRNSLYRNTSAATAFQTIVLNNQTHLKVLIRGKAYSSGSDSYRQAEEQVLEFANTLNAIPGTTVVPVTLPTDMLTAISTTVDDDELQAPFTLEVTMEKTYE